MTEPYYPNLTMKDIRHLLHGLRLELLRRYTLLKANQDGGAEVGLFLAAQALREAIRFLERTI